MWSALDTVPAKIATVFKLALLTAQRKSEVLGMQWDEIDEESNWWTIGAERAKNGLAQRVFLGPQALELLRQLRQLRNDSLHVFLGGRRGRPIENLQKPLGLLKSASGVDFKFHDLRRTPASHMAAGGVSRFVIARILNHVDSSVTAVYDRYSYDLDKKRALQHWDRRLRKIVCDQAANKVVSAL